MGYIGHLLIVVAGTLMGLYASRQLTRRVTVLCRLEQLLDTLLRQMTYTALPMSALWRQLAQSSTTAQLPLVQETVTGLEKQPFSEAFRGAVERAVAAGQLKAPEQEVLLAFGGECGQYDLSRQTAQLKGCLAQLTRLREAAEKEAAARGQIYRVMGVSGGVALALLLV